MSAALVIALRPDIDLTPDLPARLRGLVLRPEPRDRSGSPSFGGRTVNRAGQGQEVFDLRAYGEGDDVRHLDQSATARHAAPFVRRFHDERSAALILVADLRTAIAFGVRRALRSHAAAEALTLAGWRQIRTQGAGRRAQGHVGLFAATSRTEVFLPARQRDSAMMQVVGALARLHVACLAEAASESEVAPLDLRLGGLDRLLRPGGRSLLASSFDPAGDGIGGVVLRCRAKATMRLLAMSDPPRPLDGRFPVRGPRGRHGTIDRLPDPALPPGFDPAQGDWILDPVMDLRTLALELAA